MHVLTYVSYFTIGCVSSLLSPFPHEYLGHWVNGAGMGGLVPSILNVIFLAINPDPKVKGQRSRLRA